jgi:hypothetical protein
MTWLNGLMLASLLITGISEKHPPAATEKTPRLFVSHYENVLGTSLELKVLTPSEKDASTAETAIMKQHEYSPDNSSICFWRIKNSRQTFSR